MIKFIRFFILLLLGTAVIFPQGFLKRSGIKIVKGNGQEILLKGMGLGSWLVPEGYMLGTSSFANSPREIRNKIVEVTDSAFADQYFDLYRYYFMRKADIDYIAQQGFNSVRLPLHYNLLTPKDQPGVYLESGFALIDSTLKWCEANNIYLILDLHAAPGGQNAGNISDYQQGVPSLWESEQNKQRTIDLWKKIAERYKDKEWIGGYDLLNETNWNLPNNNQALRELYINITNAIRQVDTNHILFIEGNSWANDFNGLSPAWDENMAYSFHKYWNVNDQGSISGYINLRNSTNRPLWLGESGENSNQWFVECIQLLQANNIGWSWWTHKKLGSASALFSIQATSGYNQLLRYWKGEISKPSVDFCKNALLGFAVNLSLGSCIPNPGMVDALFREVNNTTTLPFGDNNVPGTIFMTEYDYGQHGYAYKDQEYQQTDGSTAWNQGWSFRNDGVDIESCSDDITNGYNVGWINTGEFLKFTINVQQAGIYRLKIRTASSSANGKIQLKLDNTVLRSFVNIPNTGGYQSWQDVVVDSVYLPSGSHAFYTTFYFTDFNLNYITFEDLATGIKEEETEVNTFALQQNYPNPFNAGTVIKYSIPQAGYTTLTVYNAIGQKVKTLVNGYKEAGSYQVSFAPGDLSSGMYFYRIQYGNNVVTKKMIILK